MTWSPPSWPQALEVSTTVLIGPLVTFWIVNVKSPRSPSKPRTSNVYVPAASVWVMISGLVPVSIDCSTVPAGSLTTKMKSVEPPGMPFTVARIVCPAVPVYGMLATGCAAVISPVVE